MGPVTRYTLRCNTASIMKIFFSFFDVKYSYPKSKNSPFPGPWRAENVGKRKYNKIFKPSTDSILSKKGGPILGAPPSHATVPLKEKSWIRFCMNKSIHQQTIEKTSIHFVGWLDNDMACILIVPCARDKSYVTGSIP